MDENEELEQLRATLTKRHNDGLDNIKKAARADIHVNQMLRDSLKWLIMLNRGVSKGGDGPEPSEWNDAWRAAEALFEPEVCFECDNTIRLNKPCDHKDCCEFYFPF